MNIEKRETELHFDSLSWVLALFGTAVGAGILFLPIQVGQSGFWVLLLVAILIFPTIYLGHCFYALIPSKTEKADYATAVGKWLPSWAGISLHLLFIAWLLILLIAYSISFTNDLGDFLSTQQLLTRNPWHRVWLSFSILAVLMLLLRFVRPLLVRILGGATLLLIGLLSLITLSLIPHWDWQIAHKAFAVPIAADGFKQFLLLFPLLALSFMFFPLVPSLCQNLQQCIPDPQQRQSKLNRIIAAAVLLLMAFLLAFVVSFMLAISKSDFLKAAQANISALALLGNLYKGSWLGDLGPMISMTALFTSFLGIFIGYRESILPLLCQWQGEDSNEKATRQYENRLYCVTFVVLWGMAVADVPVMNILGDLVAPLGALFLLLVPAGVILFSTGFCSKRRTTAWFVFTAGILVVLAYFAGTAL